MKHDNNSLSRKVEKKTKINRRRMGTSAKRGREKGLEFYPTSLANQVVPRPFYNMGILEVMWTFGRKLIA